MIREIEAALPGFAAGGGERYFNLRRGIRFGMTTDDIQTGRHVFMTERRWHSSVDECQRRKFPAKKPREYVKIGVGSQQGLAKIFFELYGDQQIEVL